MIWIWSSNDPELGPNNCQKSCFRRINKIFNLIFSIKNSKQFRLSKNGAPVDAIKKLIPLHDAIILSDYHIGTITDKIIKTVTETAKKSNKPVIVDAQKDLDRYKGVTSMTPNLPDTQKHVGFFLKNKADFIMAGTKLIKETQAPAILITCGSDGMVVITEGSYTHIPVFNKSKVFDVTGAGDTVTASYSLAIATGAEPVYAAIIGNIAASIVIKQYGCATTNVDEILASVPQKIEVENWEVIRWKKYLIN